MISYDDALKTVLANVHALEGESVPLHWAQGRVLAETLRASAPLPAFDQSAMDGYAVCAADFGGSGPWALPLHGESRTGAAPPAWAPATACRIFTGAALPAGTDSVVPQEEVELAVAHVRFVRGPQRGQHVRRAGEDLDRGAVALPEGTRLGPAQLALACGLDRGTLVVARKPHVSILCTGSELRAPGSAAEPQRIPDANGIPVAAMTHTVGGIPRLVGSVQDTLNATLRSLEAAADGADLIVTIGGVSVGDHDVVKQALLELGVRSLFWRVKIKPGKPIALGLWGRIPVLSLPGNPVSAQITYHLFGLPLLRALQGDADPLHRVWRLPLAAKVQHRLGVRSFWRAQVKDGQVHPLPQQSSGALTSTAWANGLIVLEEERSEYLAGDWVSVLMLDGH